MNFLKSIMFCFGVLVTSECSLISVSTTPALQEAQDTLVSLFDLVSSAEYKAAAEYYAGPSDDLILILQDWNPDWIPSENDPGAILEKICAGGFQCLPLRTILTERQLSKTEFEFEVEFNWHDGELFVFGPCCGATETEMPPNSVFTYKVVLAEDGDFRVEWVPIYVP